MEYGNSWVDIANEALAMIGTAHVDDLEGSDNETQFVNTLLPTVLNNVFSSYEWNCARTRAILSPITETPPFGYAYYFEFPSDLARVVEISATAYEIEGNRILSDAETINIKYIKLPSEPTLINPPKLRMGISTTLASMLAVPLAGSTSIANNLEQKALMYINEAKTIDNHNLAPEFDSPFSDNLWTSR